MRFLPDFLNLRARAEEVAGGVPGLMIAAQKLADNVVHGDHARRKAGTGEKFWQYRDYDPADRPQDIDWRQSAKGDHVFVRQKEWQVARKAYFWCARGKAMDFKSDSAQHSKGDYARILTLALAIAMRKNHEQIGVFGHSQAGRGTHMIEKLGHRFLMPGDEILPVTGMQSLPRDAFFVGAGDFLSPFEDIKRCFADFTGRTEHALILHILDPAEIDLPYTGRVRFMDNSNQDHLINHVGAVRDLYQTHLTEHCASLAQLCRKQGWHYRLCRTDETPEQVLNDLYVRLDEGRGV